MHPYRLIDADGHLDERPEEMIHYLDEPLKSQEILVRVGGPLQGLLAVEHRARALLRQKNGKAYAPYRFDPKPERWLEFADAAGIETAILYPSLGLSFGNIEDPELAWYFARGYNNWAHDRYMKTSSRLKCMALIPWQDVPEAVKELRRVVVELGMPGAMV